VWFFLEKVHETIYRVVASVCTHGETDLCSGRRGDP
jgi:hypothetical protein